jgi:hypothetical protein
MRTLKTVVVLSSLLLVGGSSRADESNKLTILTFSHSVQLPGLTLPPGKYRFELADPVESRRVIKVANEDGTKQLGLLLTIQNTINRPAKDALVLFAETPAGAPDAVKAWVYPGETIGYEFIYPREQAMKIAGQSHTSVLSKSGDKVERINEKGEVVPDTSK